MTTSGSFYAYLSKEKKLYSVNDSQVMKIKRKDISSSAQVMDFDTMVDLRKYIKLIQSAGILTSSTSAKEAENEGDDESNSGSEKSVADSESTSSAPPNLIVATGMKNPVIVKSTLNKVINPADRFKSDDIDSMLSEIFANASDSVLMNPNQVMGLGLNNIYTYRARFTERVKVAKLSRSSAMIVIQLTMQMRNYTRLLSGKTVIPAETMNDAYIKEAFVFIENHCCASTRNSGVKMPTVKIPESFPEICSLIFVMTFAIKTKNIAAQDIQVIVDKLVAMPWAASLNLNPELQEINKASVKKMWDSWGKTSGVKLNSAKEVISFNEEIYLNQAMDKINLLTMNGELFPAPNDGYSAKDLELWVKDVSNHFGTKTLFQISV